MSDTAFPADLFVRFRYCLELLLRGLLDILSESRNFVGVVLDCHLTVCFLYLLVCCVRRYLENSVVAVIARYELCEDGAYLTL